MRAQVNSPPRINPTNRAVFRSLISSPSRNLMLISRALGPPGSKANGKTPVMVRYCGARATSNDDGVRQYPVLSSSTWPGLFQALAKSRRRSEMASSDRGSRKPHRRHRRLLRPRRQWPSCRAAEECDELAPSHRALLQASGNCPLAYHTATVVRCPAPAAAGALAPGGGHRQPGERKPHGRPRYWTDFGPARPQ